MEGWTTCGLQRQCVTSPEIIATLLRACPPGPCDQGPPPNRTPLTSHPSNQSNCIIYGSAIRLPSLSNGSAPPIIVSSPLAAIGQSTGGSPQSDPSRRCNIISPVTPLHLSDITVKVILHPIAKIFFRTKPPSDHDPKKKVHKGGCRGGRGRNKKHKNEVT